MPDDILSVTLSLARSGFSLEVDERIPLSGVTALFGPSGAGKSSVLRAIAGFETPQLGMIAANGEAWFDKARRIAVPPHKRPVGMLFQDARLFDHLSVDGNLRFAEARRPAGPPAILRDEIIDALDISKLLSRRPATLSGGERQRVALGRTLLTQPKLLLLDEPLSALDRDARQQILPYLEAVPRRFNIPTLYVSHAVDEVAYLADRMIVLDQGRVVARGDTPDILERLDIEPVTGAFEAGVLISATISRHDARLSLTYAMIGEETISLPLSVDLSPGARARLRIRSRDVALATQRPEGISIRNILAGTIAEITPVPDTAHLEVYVDISGARIRARLTKAAVEELCLAPGMQIYALIKSVSFDPRPV